MKKAKDLKSHQPKGSGVATSKTISADGSIPIDENKLNADLNTTKDVTLDKSNEQAIDNKNQSDDYLSLKKDEQYYDRKLKDKIKDLKMKQSEIMKKSKKNFRTFRGIQIIIAIISLVIIVDKDLHILNLAVTILLIVDALVSPKKLWDTQERAGESLQYLIEHCENDIIEFSNIEKSHDKLDALCRQSEAIIRANSLSERTIYNNMEYAIKNETTEEKR